MSDVSLFGFQVLISLMTSALTLVYLLPVIKQLLATECEGELRAEFWTRSLALLMVLAPLVGVLVVGGADGHGTFSIIGELRRSLKVALLGQCAGLLLLTRIVWKRMVPPVGKTESANAPGYGSTKTQGAE